MADDERIRIEVDGAQAGAQLEALAAEVRALEAELEELNNTAGVTNAEIEGTTRRLGEAREKFAEASENAKTFEERATGAGFSVKEMTKSIGAGVSILAILRDNLKALEPVLQRNKDLLIEQATAAGADKETLDGLSLTMDSLIHPTHFLENAVKATAEAMQLLAEKTEGASTVVANTAETIPQMLAKINEARKKAEQENKDGKKEEEDAAKSLAKEEEALEKAAVKSAEERAKAEAKAAEQIVADLAKQEAAFSKMLEDTAKYVAERDKILNAPNKGFDSSQDNSKASEDLASLNKQIKEIQDSPLVSPEQSNQLLDLRRKAVEAARAVSDLGQSYTLANMNGEELAIKQNAAWEKYYAIRHRGDAIVQRNVDANLRSLEDQTQAVGDLSDVAEEASGFFEDLADAAGSLGDKSKRGAEKGKEGLDKLNEGFNEAIPLATQLRDLLQEIVTLGSQADI